MKQFSHSVNPAILKATLPKNIFCELTHGVYFATVAFWKGLMDKITG